MRELTARQRDVLNFMRAFSARHGVPPTVREIGDKFGVTPRAAFDHLRALERKGMLQRRAGGRTARALTLSDAAGGRASAGVPILGRVAAGQPLLAEENRDGELPIAPGALPGRAED
ncbi:MAG: repressor LexA, partial [Candidatus Rokuibacteriota bacterium]